MVVLPGGCDGAPLQCARMIASLAINMSRFSLSPLSTKCTDEDPVEGMPPSPQHPLEKKVKKKWMNPVVLYNNM